jgi:hypothetical protein
MPSVSILAPADKPQITRTTEPQYNALAEARRCSTCGRRDHWQRLLDGGWYCCSPLAPRTHQPEMAHTCTPVCAGAA